ncbi:hypothetical protein [Ancylobacter oerskovii]|uniref:Uncharacterized protein n=1 Tax=Ancylobacter oerskovii TaxID=459519 RepID=A0ABW4YYL3_9HYPH|nr:hypothetical protein [Ancylobacter oerskovii]MBS7541770.1 hypothetical protein [Ancylobacter oerskovii]
MSHHDVVAVAEVKHTSVRRFRRALMEAGVVLTLTLAIVAVLCLFGLHTASAMEMGVLDNVDPSGRLTIGAVLLAAFVALCGLSSYMLRNTLQPAEPRYRRRQG